MKRAVLLSGLVVLGTAVTVVNAARQGPAPVPIRVEKVTDNLYALRGGGPLVRVGNVTLPAGGTTVAFLTTTGVTLVDTKLPGSGKAILDALRTITDKPVTTVINTHTHDDHVGGNVEFPATVDFVAHETTASLMREMRTVSGGLPQPNIFVGSNGRGLPTRTFKERLSLGSDSDRIDLHFFGRAHTGGDAWVVFPSQRVLHTGDVFGFKTFPIVDANNGGSSVDYAQTISKAVSSLTNIEHVLTGHYPSILTMKDLAVYGEFVGEFVQAVSEAKKAGRTMQEFATTWKVPQRFLSQGYLDVQPYMDVIWSQVN